MIYLIADNYTSTQTTIVMLPMKSHLSWPYYPAKNMVHMLYFSFCELKISKFLLFTLRFQTNKIFVFYNYSLFLPGAKSPYDTGEKLLTTHTKIK